jgi:hypothetical protein
MAIMRCMGTIRASMIRRIRRIKGAIGDAWMILIPAANKVEVLGCESAALSHHAGAARRLEISSWANQGLHERCKFCAHKLLLRSVLLYICF